MKKSPIALPVLCFLAVAAAVGEEMSAVEKGAQDVQEKNPVRERKVN